jgi:hypothetical protein
MADLVRSALPVVKTAAPVAPVAPAAPAAPAELEVRVLLEPLPAPERQPPHAPVAFLWFASAETRAFFQAPGSLFGARAGVHVALTPWLAWTGDTGILASSAHDALGDIDGTVATAGAGLLGTGGAAGVLFGVGPRLEAGIGWFRGRATAPGVSSSRATAPLAFFAITGLASFPIRSSLSGLIALDAGTTLYGFSALADDRHASDFAGAMLSARIGIALGGPAPALAP